MARELSENDLFGRFFLKKAEGGGACRDYYKLLDIIRRLLRSKPWLKAVTGYYINAPLTRDWARLSYFTPCPDETMRVVEDFVSRNKMEQAEPPELPRKASVSELYGGEEIRFRRFLHLSTLIVLDLIESDVLYTRRLFAAFRFHFMKTGKPYRDHFLKSFEEMSRTYHSLGEAEKEQFWLDLKHWPNPPQVDWIHLPVNMALACDMNSFGKWNEFISSKYALSQSDIDHMLKAQGLDMPELWRP